MADTTDIIPPSRPSPMDPTVNTDAAERVVTEQLQVALAPSFILVRRIGAGGMGVVYLARDPVLKRLVAVKVLAADRAADPYARARFEREAEAVAAISHPNVVAIHSVGELTSGVPYIVMQYVEGPSMADRLHTEGPLDLATAKLIIGQVAAGLEAAHKRGIIHRDIKAANILWDEATGRALVTDFGIAAIREGDIRDQNPIHLTQTGTLIGTPRYMSPEQLLAEPVTEKTDIYSLGLLGYELLTGEGPYQVSSPHEIIAAHLRDAPRPISTMRPDADSELEALLNACLDKDPHGRPTAGDIARRLTHGSSALLEWPPPGLDALHGAIQRPLANLIKGSFAIATPLVVAATAGRVSMLRLAWPQVLVLPAIAVIGAVPTAIAIVACLRLLRVAVRAAKAGYGWGTIAEVLSDIRHDTGALIVGAREYAAVPAVKRSTLRRGRVIQVALRAGAGAWNLAGFFIMLPLAARGLGPAVLAFSTLGVSAGLLVAASILGLRETNALRNVRSKSAKVRGPLERLSNLADAWKDSFVAAMGEVGLGQGTIGHAWRRVLAVGSAAGIIGSAALLSYGLLIAPPMASETGWNNSYSLSTTVYASLKQSQASTERLAFLRPPIDPAITPLRAGQALHSIMRAGEGSAKGSDFEVPAAFPIAAIPVGSSHLTKGPFAKRWLSGGAIEQAKRGLTVEQRRFLEKQVRSVGTSEWGIVAHAHAVDYVAALGAGRTADFTEDFFSWGRGVRLEAIAYSQVARAALALADGHPDQAEEALKENIGVGLAILQLPSDGWWDGFFSQTEKGMLFATVGREGLVALYEVTGRSNEARAISRATDATLDPWRIEPSDYAAFVQAIIRDPQAMRGLRWQLTMGVLAPQPCKDLRQILFGPDSLHLARLAEARRTLVRLPGEETLMQLAEGTLRAPLTRQEFAKYYDKTTAAGWFVFARSVDLLTGSKRMESCLFRPYH
jgi:hypothetical protein